MLLPGALSATHAPRFEYDAKPSVMLVAPTVTTPGVLPGESLHAFALALPAAIAYEIPAFIELVTASFNGWKNGPPRLILATAGFTACAVTQSMPAMTAA
jgi:hypothetical protein